MKNLFLVDKTGVKIDKKYNTATLDEAHQKNLDAFSEEAKKYQSKWPETIKNIYVFVFIFMFFCGLYTVKTVNENSWNELFTKYIGLFICFVVSLVIFIALIVTSIFIRKNERKKLQESNIEQKSKIVLNDTLSYFGISNNEPFIDVLLMNNEKSRFSRRFTYNAGVYLYDKGQDFSICDIHDEWTFPKSAYVRFEYLDEHRYITSWNKEKTFKDEEFKQFKIKVSNNCLAIKGVYRLYFKFDEEEVYWEVLPYDKKYFEQILGISLFRDAD